MKRILQVVSCLEKGGTEAFIMNHYRNIDRRNYAFDFIVFIEKSYPYDDEIAQLGGRIFYVGVPGIKRLVAFIRNCIRVIKQNGPYAAVHSHVNLANSWVMLVAFLAGIPIRVSHSHDTPNYKVGIMRGSYEAVQRGIIRWMATNKLACSELAGTYLYGKRYFQKYGKVQHNGIQLQDFITEDTEAVELLREEFKLRGNIVVGNFTRFEQKKNTLFVIDVFYEILKKTADAVLLLGGPDGGLLTEAKRHVKTLGIEERVRFIGVRDDIPNCLRLLDVYIFPSLYEGLSIAALEVQAAGVPMLVSSGISRETDMELGLMHFMDLSADVKLWADKALKLVSHESPDSEAIIHAFKKKGYCIEDSVQELIKIYNGK